MVPCALCHFDTTSCNALVGSRANGESRKSFSQVNPRHGLFFKPDGIQNIWLSYSRGRFTDEVSIWVGVRQWRIKLMPELQGNFIGDVERTAGSVCGSYIIACSVQAKS